VFSIEPQLGAGGCWPRPRTTGWPRDDRRRDGQRRLHDHRRQDVGQDVAQQDARRRIADRARRLDVVLGAYRQHLAARERTKIGVAVMRWRSSRCEARAEEGGQRDGEDEERDRQHGVGDAAHHRVDARRRSRPACRAARDSTAMVTEMTPAASEAARPRSRARAGRGRPRRCRTSSRRRAPCAPWRNWWPAGRTAPATCKQRQSRHQHDHEKAEDRRARASRRRSARRAGLSCLVAGAAAGNGTAAIA